MVADDRLPVLDLPDGDACGLQIFELLGRGVASVLSIADVRKNSCQPNTPAGASGCRVHRCQKGDRIMAGKVLPLGPATFPEMVEDLQNEISVLNAAGEHPG